MLSRPVHRANGFAWRVEKGTQARTLPLSSARSFSQTVKTVRKRLVGWLAVTQTARRCTHSRSAFQAKALCDNCPPQCPRRRRRRRSSVVVVHVPILFLVPMKAVTGKSENGWMGNTWQALRFEKFCADKKIGRLFSTSRWTKIDPLICIASFSFGADSFSVNAFDCCWSISNPSSSSFSSTFFLESRSSSFFVRRWSHYFGDYPSSFLSLQRLLYAGQFGHVSFFCFLFFHHLFSPFPTTNGSLRSGRHTSTTTTVPVFRCAASRAVWRRRSCYLLQSGKLQLAAAARALCLTTNDDDAASDDRHTQDHDATKREIEILKLKLRAKIKAEQRALEDRAICVDVCVWTRWCSEDPLFTALTIAASAR